jgi:RNA 3'-terminal phosphate cyclase (ATP)
MIKCAARRRRPGLQPQHLAAVHAMRDICGASIEGAQPGAREFVFRPGRPRAGRYRFDIGTAGSTLLVLQTVLPALVNAGGPSEIEIIGGTHNPLAPSFEFVNESFVPVLARLGAVVQLAIERYGFYPKGGGKVRATVEGTAKWRPLTLPADGIVTARSAEILLARLPEHIATRELEVLGRRLDIPPACASFRRVDALGPGNVAIVRLACGALRPALTELEVRQTAEYVASALADRVERYQRIAAPVDEHLADQLLVPMVLAGGGSFVTQQPSGHTLTNAAVIESFVPFKVTTERYDEERWRIDVQSVSAGQAAPGAKVRDE